MEQADDLFTPDFLHHNVPEGTARGPEGQKAFVTAMRAQVPGLRLRIEDLIAEGDRVVARWTGTYTPPAGGERSYPGVDILRIEDGKIAELWSLVP